MAELGYVSKRELESVTFGFGQKVVRDLHFDPNPLEDCIAQTA